MLRRSLNNLADLYHAQGRYADAEPLLKRSLAIKEKVFGSDNPDVAASLNNLAELYRAQGRYADAEPLFERSLAVKEKVFGSDNPDVAAALNGLALLYQAQGRYVDAEPLYKRSLAIREIVPIVLKLPSPPMPNRCSSAPWRYEKKPTVPMTPMLPRR